MNGYFPAQYGSEEHRKMSSGGGGNDTRMMGMMGGDMSGMVGAQSLDDLVNQNSKEMRRRSVPVHNPYGPNANRSGIEGEMRRVSMMDMGGSASPGTPMGAYQFDPSATTPGIDSMLDMSDNIPRSGSQNPQRRMSSSGDLGLDTQFGQSSPYGNMAQPGSAYASPMHPTGAMDVDMGNNYPTGGMNMHLNLGDSNMGMMGNSMSPMHVFQQNQFASPMVGSPLQQEFPPSMPPPDPASTAERQDQLRSSENNSTGTDGRSASAGTQDQVRSNTRSASAMSTPNHPGHATPSQPTPFGPDAPPMGSDTQNGMQLPWTTPPGGFPSTMKNRPHMDSQFKNVYSATGFDMLGVLMRVATRPKPEIDMGSVDLSCAFVVCDVSVDDVPIVYCSENFERLTGYSKHMILGRNCRFLQSPDGQVKSGVKRKYVDDESVLYLKNMINGRREAQVSLINYRYGGQPFMNLLTMIPITWDSDDIKFYVGFQVDLVEQPNAVTKKNSDGSYSINYQRALTMPKYVLSSRADVAMDLGQTIGRDEVSAALNNLGSGDNLSRRIWDKVLLENTDDVVHVLSLKGLFLYLSPSSTKVLEYEPRELMGTALSSVCHPSDIVPVTRELKDTSNTLTVNIVFRIRRKNSGYMWFEGHGSLHTEQGKGRKCIIMVGRERPVYTLNKTELRASGGIGDNELWTKMSTAGMFLFVSANVRQMLDRQPEELVGTSIQALMRQDSKVEFGRILELARTGKKASAKHEVINKRGQVLQAFTTVYPGDAEEGLKPTFLVAQTKLLKFSRAQQAQKAQVMSKQDVASSGGLVSSTTPNPEQDRRGSSSLGASTPNNSLASSNMFFTTDGSAATFAGQHGLAIGHQDASLASEENLFDELKTTRSTSWQYELRQMEKRNRLLAEEVQSLLAAKKKRKRRKGAGHLQKDCANCHTRVTPEWRRGPSGNRDLCNSCGLRYAKQLQNGRPGSKTSSKRSGGSAHSDKASKASASPQHQITKIPTDGSGQSSAASAVATAAGVVSRASPQTARHDDPQTEAPHLDVSGSQGFPSNNPLPMKIDEGVEPPD